MSELNTHFKPRKKWEGVTKYDEDMPARAYGELASGFSKAATAGTLGIAHKTLCEWCNIHPEFNEAVIAGVSAGQKLWEELAQTPEHEQFDAKVYAFNMANIYRVNPPQPTQNLVAPADDRVTKIMNGLVNQDNE